MTNSFLIWICENPNLISQNCPHRGLLRPSIYQTWKAQQCATKAFEVMDSFTFVQSQSSFHKSNTTIRSIGPQFTKPRKIGSIQPYTRCQKLRSSMPLDPHISMRHLRFTCTYMPPHACWRMWHHWWCHLLLWFDAFIRFNLHLWPKSKPPT